MTLQVLVERDILARFVYAFMMSCMFVLGLFMPSSLAGQLYEAPNDIGKALIATAGVLAVLMAGDTYMNDVQPPDVQLRWTSRYRHLLHVAGALLYLTAVYRAIVTPGALAGVLASVYMYSGLAVIGFVIAIRDVLRRPGHAVNGT